MRLRTRPARWAGEPPAGDALPDQWQIDMIAPVVETGNSAVVSMPKASGGTTAAFAALRLNLPRPTMRRVARGSRALFTGLFPIVPELQLDAEILSAQFAHDRLQFVFRR